MRRAVALAERALGRTSPNPAVGALVVKAGRVVGEGWTRPVGGPHAEVVALRRAGARARGATLYVTLEPCAHFGRTPPCADAIVAAGVARVVVAVGDPNPRVRGRGLRILARAGVAVTTGVLAEEAGAVSAWFRHFVVRRRPFVILKLAASLDGRIATAAGASRWITGAAARRWVHTLRNRVDAVMVGSETVRADDPSLTCRVRGGRDPVRIVIDGRLQTPLAAAVVRQRSAAATIVATTAAAPVGRRRALADAGVEVIVVPAKGGKVDLGTLLRGLAARGIVSVLVEGGGDLAAAMVRARLVDRLAVITAPVLLGGDGRPMLGALGLRRLGDAPRLVRQTVVRLGRDLLRDGPVAY
ncbi:MAG: bifunctional diaminohydroxyphosphoribosylaminopyrimidine deaminase/5-amino-6-(5-phosphoribosylamino)uracil reductase RibD [Deltaproteobacteria bacterium]|nr:bifunctional diaminohydroxyphosphoribosylaminopyrimidine deaminase/5-amino-6-(5-phosphoribosylamino)uracil reductase RibD [Deltaproteobacteria bacterium]